MARCASLAVQAIHGGMIGVSGSQVLATTLHNEKKAAQSSKQDIGRQAIWEYQRTQGRRTAKPEPCRSKFQISPSLITERRSCSNEPPGVTNSGSKEEVSDV